ncbi:site-specific integrase [bacterium]|nr:site-specific integrase [bacterium]
MSKRRRAQKGRGCLFKPKGRNFWYFKHTTRQGKTKWVSTGTADREQAEGFCTRLLSEVERGISIDAARIKFAELAVDLVKNYKRKRRKTIDDLVYRLDKYILPFYGIRKAKDLIPADHDAFVSLRSEQGASDGEINAELSHVRAILNLAWKNGKLLTRPYIEFQPKVKGRTTFWRENEIVALLNVWKSDWTRPMIELASWIGWRVSEIQNLIWSENVDWENRRLVLPPNVTKTGKPRIFPFIPEVARILKEQHEKTVALQKVTGTIIPWVFHRSGEKIVSWHKEWYAAMKAGKFAGKKRHDFRSTAARRLLNMGFHPLEVCKMVGWESLDMLKYYSVLEAADLDAAVARVCGSQVDAVFERKARPQVDDKLTQETVFMVDSKVSRR